MKMLQKTLFWGAVLGGLTACSGILSRRTFIDEMDRDRGGFFRPGEDFPVTPGDTGMAYLGREEMLRRTPAFAGEEELSLKDELAEREGRLSSQEYFSYQKASRHFESDSERIFFLSLSREERASYLEEKERKEGRREEERGVSRFYRKRPLQLAMSKGAVRRLWGLPTRIEVAGDPGEENERWTFYHNGRPRLVYFERGVVGGWLLK